MEADLRYQIVLYEATSRGRDVQLRGILEDRVKDLGLDPEATLKFLDATDAASVHSGAPRVGVYFGGADYHDTAASHFRQLIASMVPVLPVVDSLKNFANEVPIDVFSKINAFEFTLKMDALASVVLESLRLLRARRRIFISYKRVESEVAAMQLYRKLDERSFDVFLDTLSVRQGEIFQEQLWHRMADCDLVVLLHTPSVLERKDPAKPGWVEQELDRADASGITVLQVIWPGCPRSPRTHLFLPFQLTDQDFVGSKSGSAPPGGYLLEDTKLTALVNEIERARAHALRSREKLLADKLCGLARQKKRRSQVQRVSRVGKDGNNLSAPCVFVWPAAGETPARVFLGLGVPDSLAFHDVFPEDKSKVYLMYDERSIASFWERHLEWLVPLLPVEAKKAWEAEKWIDTI